MLRRKRTLFVDNGFGSGPQILRQLRIACGGVNMNAVFVTVRKVRTRVLSHLGGQRSVQSGCRTYSSQTRQNDYLEQI